MSTARTKKQRQSKRDDTSNGRKLSRYHTRKLRCVLALGGKCGRCGYDHHLAALQFHHCNPEDKLYEIARLMPRLSDLNFENFLLPEILNKCELVCSNCHDIEHFGGGWAGVKW